MQFRVLGPLEVVDAEGRPIDLGGSQQRSVLAMLLIAGDRIVPADAIIERLWPERPPPSAASTLQSYISRLRRTLEAHRPGDSGKALTWESSGYRLHTGDDIVDFREFEQAADAGHELLAGQSVREAHSVLTKALQLWRGAALLELADQPWARGVATRLDERRLAAIEDRVRADLLLGRHELVVGELSDLVDAHPLREGLWELLAMALYRSGRQAEALRAIDELRRQLVEGLGVDPSLRIRDLESQILAQDPALAPPAVAAVAGDAGDRGASHPSLDEEHDDVTGLKPGLARGGRHFAGMMTDDIVGRHTEIDVLSGALAVAAQGRTQWVLLEGEPGIGKTRLLEHLADLAAGRGFDVLWGRSYETGAAPAFWPWLPPLRGIAEVVNTLPAATRELIERLLAPTGEEALVGPLDAGRFRLFEAIALLLETAAQRRPVMLAIDDLQWADPASLELIEFLTGHVIGSPIIFAATVRELEIGRNDLVVHALAHVSRRPLTRRLKLAGLLADESAELVKQTIGGDVSAEVVQAIHQRSEGNPFFVSELARLLSFEAGLTEAELVRRAAVPAGVRDVIHRRLVRLAPATVELIQMAATLGCDTQVGFLSRAAGISVDRCLDDVEPALLSRLLVEVPDNPGMVQFTHALIREVVLDDMSVVRRSRLHLRAADAIEGMGQADDNAEILAEHLWQAASLGIEERAAAALLRAAEVALRRFAYETADGLLERALQLLRDLPPERVDAEVELDAMNRLTAVRRVRFGFEGARLHAPIERAKQLARNAGRERVLMELLWTEWAGAATACDLPTANRLSREMVEMAVHSDDPWIRSTGHASWGTQCWHEGRIGEAMASLDLAVAELGNEVLLAPDQNVPPGLLEALVLSHGFLVLVHELAGAPLDGGSPLPSLARAQQDPYVQLVLWVCEAVRSLVGADYAAAQVAVESAAAIDVGQEFEFFRSGAMCLYGAVQVVSGHPSEGYATIMSSLVSYQSVGVHTVVSFYRTFAAEGLLAVGDIGGAADAIGKAMDVIEETNERWEEPFVLSTTAAVRHAQGAPAAEVAALFARAGDIAVAQGAFGSASRVRERASLLGFTLQ